MLILKLAEIMQYKSFLYSFCMIAIVKISLEFDVFFGFVKNIISDCCAKHCFWCYFSLSYYLKVFIRLSQSITLGKFDPILCAKCVEKP